MSEKDYKKEIIDKLLKKYNQRLVNQVNTKRRVIVKPRELYGDYANNHADISEKQRLEEAVQELLKTEVVQVKLLKFSTDIEKIYLCEEQVGQLDEILKKEYGIVSQYDVRIQLDTLLYRYENNERLPVTSIYCRQIRSRMNDPRIKIDVSMVRANLKMLTFLEKNEESLYIREVSMIVYGDSKWFEDNNLEEICGILRNALTITREEDERQDAILAKYHVNPAEQEIFIKGDWKIEWGRYTLETKALQGGLAIASKDIEGIQHIQVKVSTVMTIENKISYQRVTNKKMATMYLGGFATRYQIEFLKKVKQDNPDLYYLHFGDIDVGGFWIHKHLCQRTNIPFELYAMGKQQLRDKRFAHCLKTLTQNDRRRMEQLRTQELYQDVLDYMSIQNIKLEQEIISYYLQKEQ
ncbi:MAG: DUF2220 family protein [Lachnospiraceae bacterium]|nr:DUF2220 family protein [Lachnospiraceae bacterium]